jgi:DNA-binding transcriptional MerR regulator
VTPDGLLSVGQFAKLAGLTTHTLRHYDAVDLLQPQSVDAGTGYRRYSHEQIVMARLISDLRWLAIPIDQVRTIIRDPQSPEARTVLSRHAERLIRERDHLDRQIAQCTTYAQQGAPMPTIATGTTPVQIKLAVADKTLARAFYEAAFGLAESVIRHTDDADFTGFQFGSYGQPGFFLVILADPTSFDQPGTSTIGLSVSDLEDAHRRALAAGATDAVAVNTRPGMPRNSAVTDPDGNWIWLYQG